MWYTVTFSGRYSQYVFIVFPVGYVFRVSLVTNVPFRSYARLNDYLSLRLIVSQ